MLHNFFMSFVTNTIYISSFDLSATIMTKEAPGHSIYTQATRLNQQASTKEENSNTCSVMKEKVGH